MSLVAEQPRLDHPGVDAAGQRNAHRPLPWWTIVAALGIGSFATAFGIGIGIRHVTKAGLTYAGAAGLITLLVGLTLLGVVGAAAWRATRGWRRLWLAPAAFLTFEAVLIVASASMYAFAPRTSLGSVTPADHGLAYSDVTFRTTDNVTLSAWYVRSANHAAVVLLPGSGSTRAATLDQAEVLAAHGYGALMVDPRGQGRSGGRAMDIGWYGDRDVSAAVTFLQRQPDVDPARVGVLGLSMGGEEAIGAAAADAHVRAVVAEGATMRTAADKAGWAPGGALSRSVSRFGGDVTDAITGLLSGVRRPIALHTAIARAPQAHFLLITAGKVADERRAAAYFRSAAPNRVQVWDVRGATHTHGLRTSPARWTEFVIAFFDRELPHS